jgi:Uma2 family endonuclease
MATIAATAAQLPITLDMASVERVVFRPEPNLTDDEFFDFCQQHELLRIERNAEGEIIVMAPVGFEGGFTESQVSIELATWAKRDGRGLALGPNAGLKLPDGSTFAPDAFWITNEQWKAIPRKQRKKFVPIVPPFVIEVRSETDRKKDLYEKMLTYMQNGVEFGWLIDPLSRKVSIYRPNELPIELDNPSRIEGEGPVTGFVLDLKQIYDQLDQ